MISYSDLPANATPSEWYLSPSTQIDERDDALAGFGAMPDVAILGDMFDAWGQL